MDLRTNETQLKKPFVNWKISKKKRSRIKYRETKRLNFWTKDIILKETIRKCNI